MGRRCILSVFALVLVVGTSVPVRAQAGEARVLLCYGATYRVAGAERTHHGADLAMAVDAAVESFADGEVSFCGRVPADDGGSVLAVTVRMSDGTLVSLHPLAECWVNQGDVISAGDGLGMVAETGDASTVEPHVHLSARRGGSYLDPGFLLSVATPVQPRQPVGSPATGDSALPVREAAPAPDLAAVQQSGASVEIAPDALVTGSGQAPVDVSTPAMAERGTSAVELRLPMPSEPVDGVAPREVATWSPNRAWSASRDAGAATRGAVAAGSAGIALLVMGLVRRRFVPAMELE